MKKRELLVRNKFFRLVKHTRSHKIWYEIQTDWDDRLDPAEIDQHFGRPVNGFYGVWRFRNRIEAHKQFVYTTLRWC